MQYGYFTFALIKLMSCSDQCLMLYVCAMLHTMTFAAFEQYRRVRELNNICFPHLFLVVPVTLAYLARSDWTFDSRRANLISAFLWRLAANHASFENLLPEMESVLRKLLPSCPKEETKAHYFNLITAGKSECSSSFKCNILHACIMGQLYQYLIR